MFNTKVNLTIILQGRAMLSEQECSRQLRKPIINKKGKYAGKQARDKKGRPLYYYETVPDLDKLDRHTLRVDAIVDGKKEVEVINFYTRKNREVEQVINISEEAYKYFVSNEMPNGFRAPREFKPFAPTKSFLNKKTKRFVEGIPIEVQAWRSFSAQQRLEWHLNSICASRGGRMKSYTVFND